MPQSNQIMETLNQNFDSTNANLSIMNANLSITNHNIIVANLKLEAIMAHLGISTFSLCHSHQIDPR